MAEQSPSFSSVLYDCATECALRRQNRRCKERFGGYACNGCKFNVNRYIDADPRQVELFMLQAETRAGAVRSAGNKHRIVFLALIAFCLWAAFADYKAEQRRIERRTELAPRDSSQAAALRNVEATLVRVSNDLARDVDVNRDGKINCIDAAVLFYKHYPDRSGVCIVLNRNDATGMHHLFNGVYISGEWRMIEPQAVFHRNSSYWMREVWGNQYDPKLNVDATDTYARYAR